MTLTIYTDGGSLNNPGKAASSYVIYKDSTLFVQNAILIGIETNNVAEYSALVFALEEVKKIFLSSYKSIKKIFCYSDSLLMVNQLNGLFKIKDGRLKEYVFKIRVLEQELKIPISYTYVPREKNMLTDSLIKQILYS